PLVRCTTETNRAVRNSGSDVWQSTAKGTDQDDLAAAWRTPLLMQAGARLISPVGRGGQGEFSLWFCFAKAFVRFATLSAMLHRTSLNFYRPVMSFDTLNQKGHSKDP